MNRVYTCILCPNSCEITVDYEGKIVRSTEGNKCDKGKEYVTQELTDPKRTVTSSVEIIGGERPLASVRLTAPVSRDLIFPLMEKLQKMTLPAPVEPGQVVLSKVFDTDADLIITSRVAKK